MASPDSPPLPWSIARNLENKTCEGTVTGRDAAASREAVEGFLVYTATLPQAEQDALEDLRVPTKDSHTGQPFDVTIGDAVEDAQANRQCVHKTGDLLRQAAKFLANQKAGAKIPGAWS